ncbi:MAG: hypothetical protein ACRC46_02105 [Thermoguttaceae bacterium]
MSFSESRRSGLECLAVNPTDGKTDLLLTLSIDKVKSLQRRANVADVYRVQLVRSVLDSPTAIFQGIRFEDDERHTCDRPGWLCYCGLPTKDYTSSGAEINPPPKKVFLAFVNDEHIVYNWGWERADLDAWESGLYFPKEHRRRFQERVL